MTRLVGPVLSAGALRDKKQPIIAVDRQWVLRPWTEIDVPALIAAYADPDIQRWNLNSYEENETRELVRTWNEAWKNETSASWALATTSDDLAIGQVGMRSIDLVGGEAEIWYWIAPEARGAGAATRALDTLSEWLLHNLGLHRLELGHSIHNVASCRVAAKAGYLPKAR